jgi:toxin ParE1/3/4
MKPVILRREARVELDEAIDYYQLQRDGLGLDFLAEAERVFERIRQNPHTGAPYKATGLRRSLLQRFPYAVFYEEAEEVSWIVAVAHTSRRPDYWRDRLN